MTRVVCGLAGFGCAAGAGSVVECSCALKSEAASAAELADCLLRQCVPAEGLLRRSRVTGAEGLRGLVSAGVQNKRASRNTGRKPTNKPTTAPTQTQEKIKVVSECRAQPIKCGALRGVQLARAAIKPVLLCWMKDDPEFGQGCCPIRNDLQRDVIHRKAASLPPGDGRVRHPREHHPKKISSSHFIARRDERIDRNRWSEQNSENSETLINEAQPHKPARDLRTESNRAPAVTDAVAGPATNICHRAMHEVAGNDLEGRNHGVGDVEHAVTVLREPEPGALVVAAEHLEEPQSQ